MNHQPLTILRFQDLALAASYLYHSFELETEAPGGPTRLVTFVVTRSAETEQVAQHYITSSLRLAPRGFYDALGIAKRLVHRAREAE